MRPATDAAGGPLLRRRALLLVPLLGAAIIGIAFFLMLQRMGEGRFDPHGIPSPLIGKPMPDFDLPAQAPGSGFSAADVRAAGHPVLINFFASWCIPCAEEAPELMKLSQAGVSIWGIAYKDGEAAAQGFLTRYGDPYGRLARDTSGRVAINFGLYGVPETDFIDKQGIVRWRWAGPLTPDIISEQLEPLLRKYR